MRKKQLDHLSGGQRMQRIELANKNTISDALALINNWAKLFLQLESNHSIRRMEVSNLDYDFLYTLGQSLYYLNLYNAHLFKSFNLGKDSCRETKEISTYIRYFNNLTTSKVKHFFFRESPIVNTNNNDIDYNWEIYINAKQILDNINDNRKINSTKKHVYLYMLHLSMAYSVLYNAHTNKGLFLHFQKDDRKAFSDFTKLKQHFLALIDDISSESELRKFSDEFYIHYFNYYTKNNEDTFNSAETVSNTYAKFYDHFKTNDTLTLEKFTYRLGEIVWKFDGMIQDDDEFCTPEGKLDRDSKLLVAFKAYITNYFNLIQNPKHYANPPYLKFFELESSFLRTSYDILLRQKRRKDVLSVFNTIHTESFAYSSFQQSTTETLDIDRIVNSCRQHGENGFRIESLLTNLEKEELLGLLGLFVQFVDKPILQNPRTEIVGMYKSGVFLAHLVNIFFRLEKPVWLFKTKPYVATHPVHSETFDDNDDGYNNIVVFDDVLKTGFTFFMYENYLSRNLNKNNLSLSLFTLTRFEHYKTITSACSFNSSSLLQLNQELVPNNYQTLKILNNNIAYSFSLPRFNRNAVPDLIKLITSNDRFDLSYLLADSHICLSICSLFSEHILTKFGENYRNLALFSPSPDGEVLALLTGLLLRLKDKNICFMKERIPAGFVKICIDMSLITGTTMDISLRNCTNFSTERSNTFDLVIAIVMSKTFSAKTNHFALYEVDL